MMKTVERRFAKGVVILILAFCAQFASAGVYQHGTVVRMRMVDCLPVHHGFITAMGGGPAQATGDVCPEYTLVSDRVVFVIVGKSSNELVPLADIVDFRLNKNELAMRIDDAQRETKFNIKSMVLRTDWDRIQEHLSDQMNNSARTTDTNVALRRETDVQNKRELH